MPRSRIPDGAVAGLLAAAAQAVMSRAVAPRLPEPMRPPVFVPAEIVRWLQRRRIGPARLSERETDAAAYLLHLGYGAALGALYARTPLPARLPSVAAGAALGLGAWAVGFQGWVPALGILPRATQRPVAQWPAPVLGHLFYGGVTALVFAALRRARMPRSAPGA
jgi:hypothetical protein